MSQTVETMYGTFQLTWTTLWASKSVKCAYDEDENMRVNFKCSKVDKNLKFVPTYNCINTIKTKDLENLAEEVIFNTVILNKSKYHILYM